MLLLDNQGGSGREEDREGTCNREKPNG